MNGILNRDITDRMAQLESPSDPGAAMAWRLACDLYAQAKRIGANKTTLSKIEQAALDLHPDWDWEESFSADEPF